MTKRVLESDKGAFFKNPYFKFLPYSWCDPDSLRSYAPLFVALLCSCSTEAIFQKAGIELKLDATQ